MTDAYEIREALPSDVVAIADFHTTCWREAYRGLVPDDYLDSVDARARERRWRQRIVAGERQVAVAWAGGLIAGVVSWATRTTTAEVPPLELTSLYVGRPSGATATPPEPEPTAPSSTSPCA